MEPGDRTRRRAPGSFLALAAGLTASILLAAGTPASASSVSIAQIASGTQHTCALTTEGEVWCWGQGVLGQLGDGSRLRFLEPVRVSTDTPGFGSRNIVAITAGAFHTCALNRAGRAFCWGFNSNGEVGDGTRFMRPVPTPVALTTPGFNRNNIAAISAGAEHTCAINTAGRAFCWGSNLDGQLGDGTDEDRLVPTPVSTAAPGFGIRNVASIAAGRDNTCAINQNGRAFCWGGNGSGQIGDGTFLWRSTPTPVSLATPGFTRRNIAEIDVGDRHVCARTTAGRTFCWGFGADGQLGYGDNQDRTRPTPIDTSAPGLFARNVDAVATGGDHSCAITRAGRLYCWGRNQHGQLGNNSIIGSLVPTPVNTSAAGLNQQNVVAVDGGWWHSCALTRQGRVYCWGWNLNGQLGDGGLDSRSVPAEVVFD